MFSNSVEISTISTESIDENTDIFEKLKIAGTCQRTQFIAREEDFAAHKLHADAIIRLREWVCSVAGSNVHFDISYDGVVSLEVDAAVQLDKKELEGICVVLDKAFISGTRYVYVTKTFENVAYPSAPLYLSLYVSDAYEAEMALDITGGAPLFVPSHDTSDTCLHEEGSYFELIASFNAITHDRAQAISA